MGTDGEYSGTGGSHPKGLGDVLLGGGTGSAAIHVVDVGDDPPHGMGPGNISTRVHKEDKRGTDEDMGGGGLGISTAGGSNGGGRF